MVAIPTSSSASVTTMIRRKTKFAVKKTATVRRQSDFGFHHSKKLWDGRPGTPTILCLGCGVGSDVDQLCAAGFRVAGIDNGKRAAAWTMHQNGPSFFRANGQHMPFEDETFDFAYCGCVFPHVGVEGVTYNVTEDYYEQRLALAKEMVRVVKKRGPSVVIQTGIFLLISFTATGAGDSPHGARAALIPFCYPPRIMSACLAKQAAGNLNRCP
jgi:Methyltransferase domain